MSPPESASPDDPGPMRPRRRLRAVFAADIANFGGLVTIDETRTIDALSITRRVAREELAAQGGWLFGLPGDGVFALFESTVNAVRCALRIQSRLAESPKLYALKLRVGIHLGEVLFQDELPFGEALVIASRLESLAEPGGILISSSVMDAVASHIAATFIESGVRTLKHSPRRIETFQVLPAPAARTPGPAAAMLDRTVAPKPSPPRAPAPRAGLADATAIPRMPKATPLMLPTETLATVESPLSASLSMAPISAKAIPASPLDAPATGNGPAEAQSLTAEAAGLDDASLGQLVRLLAVHLGPVAKVLVRRKAAEIPDAAQLVWMLAQEIPAEGERLNFLARARAVLAGAN